MYIDTECTHYVWSGSEVVASIHWWCHQTAFLADLITASVYFTIKSQHGPRTITLSVKYIKMLWEHFLIARKKKKKKRCPKFFPRHHLQLYAKHWVLPLYSAAAAPATRVVAYICQCCRFGCFYHSVVFAEEQAFLFSSKESSAIAKKIFWQIKAWWVFLKSWKARTALPECYEKNSLPYFMVHKVSPNSSRDKLIGLSLLWHYTECAHRPPGEWWPGWTPRLHSQRWQKQGRVWEMLCRSWLCHQPATQALTHPARSCRGQVVAFHPACAKGSRVVWQLQFW